MGFKPETAFTSYYRPGGGFFWPSTVRFVRSLGYRIVLGSGMALDVREWIPDWYKVNVLKTMVQSGRIFIIHDREYNVNSLDQVLKYAKDQGYVVGTISELLSVQGVSKEN